MLMIDWFHLVMAILFLVSALIKMAQRQPEHFFTRLMNSAWFCVTVLDRDMNVDTVRLFSTGLIIIMLMAEVTSPFFRWNLKRQR